MPEPMELREVDSIPRMVRYVRCGDNKKARIRFAILLVVVIIGVVAFLIFYIGQIF